MEAIIFDVDGTLWDSVDVVLKAWQTAVNEFPDTNVTLTNERLKGLFGKTMTDIFDDLFPDLSAEKRHELEGVMSIYEKELLSVKDSCPLYPNVYETIKKLSTKYKLYIVSNCQTGYIDALFKSSGLGEFIIDHTCFGDTGNPKGDNIKAIIEKHNLKSVVYVGDTPTDYTACQVANIPMIFASYGFGNVEGITTIKDFSELLDMDFSNLVM